MSGLKSLLEALLFAAEAPLTLACLVELLGSEGEEARAGLKKEISQGLKILQEEYQQAEHGIELLEISNGYQLRTKTEHAPWICRLNEPRATRLSTPAVESLAIIAYRQPMTRSEIEQIRGVDSGAVLKGLLERRLIKILGRKEEPGRPLLYGTTAEFLELFGLKDLQELPPLRELEQRVLQGTTTAEGQGAGLGEGGIAELQIDPGFIESLAEEEREAFAELEARLDELKAEDKKTQELIAPKQENQDGGLITDQDEALTEESNDVLENSTGQ